MSAERHALLRRPVLVLGGGGFIGLHVCRELSARGASPWIADLFLHGDASRRAAAEVAGAVMHLDARDADAVEHATRQHDLVLNLATVCVRASLRDPVGVAADVSAIGAATAFGCAAAGVQRYVYVSSSEVYGEAVAGPLHEGCLPRPQTTYGAAKLMGEHAATAARLAHGTDIVIVRPFNAYGPGSHVGGVTGEAIPRWIAQAHRQEVLTVHGTGQQTRDYTHVTDFARGIVDAALSDAAVNTGPVNLCSGVERAMIDVARDVIRPFLNTPGIVRDLRRDARPADLRRQVGCCARARVLLGWESRVAWKDGLEATRDDVLARLDAGEGVDVPERTWT